MRSSASHNRRSNNHESGSCTNNCLVGGSYWAPRGADQMTDVGRTQQGVRRYCSCSEIVWRAVGASIRNLTPTIVIAIAIIAYAVLSTDSFARDALGTVELSKAFDLGK